LRLTRIIATAEANLKAREENAYDHRHQVVESRSIRSWLQGRGKEGQGQADKPLSKAQAGKVAPRAKGAKPQTGAQA